MVSSPLFANAEHIACYLPQKHEFDTRPLIEIIWQQKKYCYLPRIKDDSRELNFLRHNKEDELQLNCYSILEPIETSQQIPPEKLDLVIVPLLAFDRLGHRLGTGGGYYDHTFSFLKGQYVKHPTMLGLGYAAQEVEKLPHDPWDIFLQGIVTEQELISIK